MPAPGTPPTLDELKRLQREAERLLRAAELDLRQTLVAEKDPASVIATHRARLDAFSKTAATVFPALESDTRKRFEEMARRATRAHEQRPQYADGKYVRAYDEAVSGALARAPGQAAGAGHDQIARAIKQLVDGVLPASMVRPDQVGSWGQAKQQIATSLAKWVEDQELVEDAFFVAQSALLDAAQFLQRNLTIHAEIKQLKVRTEQSRALDAPTAKQVDAQAGALGKAWNQSVQQGEQAVKKSASLRSDLRLDPKLVLDPSKKFLTELNVKAGITIETSQIRIQLSGHVTIVEPLQDSRRVTGGQELSVQRGPWSLTEKLAVDPRGTDFATGVNYTRGNFTGGASYQNDHGVPSVKASITFRF